MNKKYQGNSNNGGQRKWNTQCQCGAFSKALCACIIALERDFIKDMNDINNINNGGGYGGNGGYDGNGGFGGYGGNGGW